MKSNLSALLSERLHELLNQVQEGSSFTVNSILAQADKESFGLILAILAVPAGLLSIYGCPFGVVILGLAFQWLRARPLANIPQWAGERHLRKGLILHGIRLGVKILEIFEFLSRQRARWMWSFWGRSATFLALFGMGFLASLPLPLTHTIPGIFIGLIGLSIAVRDGWFLAFFTFSACVAFGCYAYIGYLLVYYGMEGVQLFYNKVLMFLSLK